MFSGANVRIIFQSANYYYKSFASFYFFAFSNKLLHHKMEGLPPPKIALPKLINYYKRYLELACFSCECWCGHRRNIYIIYITILQAIVAFVLYMSKLFANFTKVISNDLKTFEHDD